MISKINGNTKLVHEKSLLVLFGKGKELLHLKGCWDVSLPRILNSSISCPPCRGTRGPSGVRPHYQATRCAFSSTSVTK